MEKFYWKFIDKFGTFVCKGPENLSRLYFPLANEAEFMSVITPDLKGDIKTSQNTFLLAPATTEDLHNRRDARHFWVYLDKNRIWSLAGANGFSRGDSVTLEAGLLWHKIIRLNKKLGLRAEILNFVPASGEHVEIMQVKITNVSRKTIKFTPTAAIPIFGRSADNLRDHHHVTSLLNRISLNKYGVVNKPVMTFDERGHRINYISYFVLGVAQNKQAPDGFFPTVEGFIGEGANLDYPEAILKNLTPKTKIEPQHQGKECLGGLRFKAQLLKPGQSKQFSLLLGIAEERLEIQRILNKFNTESRILSALNKTKEYWQQKLSKIAFVTGDSNFDNWLNWVRLQPVLRAIYGCSFLPDFDYGRGGKGWRDLWQDCLALILCDGEALRPLLTSNFSGVRVDGSNATIITKRPGYFIADRNRIARVWMDHGVWPYFTLELYIHRTGDFDILFEKSAYFRDLHLNRASLIDHNWNEAHKHLYTINGKIYHGTILEHILVQHLVQFLNVGKHNNIRLEGADWNDGLDMARHNGESVPFSAFYGRNLKSLARLLQKLSQDKKITNIKVFRELLILLAPINFADYKAKQEQLSKYFKATQKFISGKTVSLPIHKLIKDLDSRADFILKHIREKEWINLGKGTGLFNGYYDDGGRRVEGRFRNAMRMTLTGQAFPILSGAATEQQIRKTFSATKKFLKDKSLGGYRLNTDFKEVKLNLGRAFGFAYGNKENGAFFSHMNVMFAYGLYERGFARQGFEVLSSIYRMSTDLTKSKIYPGIPEYFNLTGRGMYSYLTGSASWYILTLLTQVFGIKGEYGDLVIQPKFTAEQFAKKSEISVATYFLGRKITVRYFNPKRLSFPDYKIKKVYITPLLEFILASDVKLIITKSAILSQKKDISLKISL